MSDPSTKSLRRTMFVFIVYFIIMAVGIFWYGREYDLRTWQDIKNFSANAGAIHMDKAQVDLTESVLLSIKRNTDGYLSSIAGLLAMVFMFSVISLIGMFHARMDRLEKKMEALEKGTGDVPPVHGAS